MLSILIPTYNYEIVSLVKILFKQLNEQNFTFEIICFENGSNKDLVAKNSEINNLDNCFYGTLKNNCGRSKTRNLLAHKAKYDWLLFLDADVLPVNDDFITIYFESIYKKDLKVAFGGLKYQEKPSSDKMLRWVYGKSREEIPLNIRNKKPQDHFTSANFLIKKEVFEQFRFDESIVDYGYEDTLLAIELKRNNVKIIQIDNPVYHLGIDKSDVFLQKTKESIKNLHQLYLQNKIDTHDFKILKIFARIKRYKLLPFFKVMFIKQSKYLEENLLSKNPSLLIYDLYKLGYLCSLKTE